MTKKDVLERLESLFTNLEGKVMKSAVDYWLTTSNPALGGKIPNTLMETKEGIDLVSNLIGRLENGVFS